MSNPNNKCDCKHDIITQRAASPFAKSPGEVFAKCGSNQTSEVFAKCGSNQTSEVFAKCGSNQTSEVSKIGNNSNSYESFDNDIVNLIMNLYAL
jgi:hypothetical protein